MTTQKKIGVYEQFRHDLGEIRGKDLEGDDGYTASELRKACMKWRSNWFRANAAGLSPYQWDTVAKGVHRVAALSKKLGVAAAMTPDIGGQPSVRFSSDRGEVWLNVAKKKKEVETKIVLSAAEYIALFANRA